MKHGHISTVHTVHCGGCGMWYTNAGGGSKAELSTEARDRGWELTRVFGWLCKLCAADTTAVIMGTAAHIQNDRRKA